MSKVSHVVKAQIRLGQRVSLYGCFDRFIDLAGVHFKLCIYRGIWTYRRSRSRYDNGFAAGCVGRTTLCVIVFVSDESDTCHM